MTREWVRKAEGDWQVANHEAAEASPVNDAVCFHCQQCAEKYLKALLQELRRPTGQGNTRTGRLPAPRPAAQETLPCTVLTRPRSALLRKFNESGGIYSVVGPAASRLLVINKG